MSDAIQPTACPDAATLRALLDATLPEEQQAATQAHVDQCRACEVALRQMTVGSQSWIGMAEKLKSSNDDDPKLAAAMERLKTDDGSGGESDETVDPQRTLDFLQPSDDPKSLGRLGQHEVLEVIGWGGMGVVLKAYDASLHRVVAVKVLASHLAHHAVARKRFIREAQAAAAVCHDNVVTIHAIEDGSVSPLGHVTRSVSEGERFSNLGNTGSTARGAPALAHASGYLPKIVMQFVAGGSLQERIDSDGPLELKEILRIAMQTAAGLAAAHAQGVVHRDVKPANILLENGVQRVKLTDFGLARVMDDASLTLSGVIAGTPQYMAPEQAWGRDVDARADLFSLGAVMYAMCSGHSPFRARTTMAVLKRVCEDAPRPLRAINPDVPGWLVAIIEKLLAKNPDDRFQSANEVSELLSRWLAHVQQPNVVPSPKLFAPVAGGMGRARLAPSPREITDATADSLLALNELQRRPEELRHQLLVLRRAFCIFAGVAIPALLLLLTFVPNYPAWTSIEPFWYGMAILIAAVGFLILLGKVGWSLFASDGKSANVWREALTSAASPDRRSSESSTDGGDPHTELRWQLGLKHILWPVLVTATLLGILLVLLVMETGTRNVGSFLGFCLFHLLATFALSSTFRTAWNTSSWIVWIGAMLFLPAAASVFWWAAAYQHAPVATALVCSLQGLMALAFWFVLLFVCPLLKRDVERSTKSRRIGWQRLLAFDLLVVFVVPVLLMWFLRESSSESRPTDKPPIVTDVAQPKPADASPQPSTNSTASTAIPADLKPLLGRWVVVSVEGTARGSAALMAESGGSAFGPAMGSGASGGAPMMAGAFGGGGMGAGNVAPPLQWIEFTEDRVVVFDGREAKLVAEFSDGAKDEPKRLSLMFASAPSPDVSSDWRYGIYRLERDRLIVCWTNGGRPMPTEFASDPSNSGSPQLLVLRREWNPPSDFDPTKTVPLLAVMPFTANEGQRFQEAWAKASDVPVETINSLGMKLRVIPPGEFESLTLLNDFPMQQIAPYVSEPFYLATHEVTIAQFRKFVEATKYVTSAEWRDERNRERPTWRKPAIVQDSDQHPVVRLAWRDANMFCRWLSDTEQQTYRLPTVSEWAFAARCGAPSWVPLKLPHNTRMRFFDTTAPVGSDTANLFGLHEMFGNVSEWAMDGLGLGNPPEKASYYRVSIGGGCRSTRGDDRSSAWLLPYLADESVKDDEIGFRVARVIAKDTDLLDSAQMPIEELIATGTTVPWRLKPVKGDDVSLATNGLDPAKFPSPVIAVRGLIPVALFPVEMDCVDFEVERAHTSLNGPEDLDLNSASGRLNWRTLDLRKTRELLEQCDHAPDTIPLALMDSAVTMPLLKLSEGTWGNAATHPNLPTVEPASKYAIEHRLFRFFDFDVNNRHAYRYRVRLKLKPSRIRDGDEPVPTTYSAWATTTKWESVEK